MNLADGPSHRQSLAFELAAAMEPEENDQASILDHLGLGDDDDDGPEDSEQEQDELEGETDIVYEDVEFESEPYSDQPSLAQQLQEPRLRLQPSRATMVSSHTQYSNPSNELDLSPGRSSTRGLSLFTPSRGPKPKLSRSTLHTMDHTPRETSGVLEIDQLGHSITDEHYQSPTEVDDDSKGDLTIGSGRTLEDFDSSEDGQDDEILQAGLNSTAKFLNLLKQSNTDCSVSLRQMPTKTHPTYTSTETATTTTGGNKSDRQPILEKMITDIVRTMTEQVRDRESQIRELKEIEIALSRTDRRALADLEALPNVLQDDDFRNCTILGKFTPQSDHALPKSIEDSVDEEDEVGNDEELEEGGRLTPKDVHSSHKGENSSGQKQIKSQSEIENGKKPMENLQDLKSITNSLISSLTQINEHTQISRQTQIEIVRKLKGVKGLVYNWKSDFDSIQSSIDFISNWELNLFPPTSDQNNGKKDVERRGTGRNKIRGVFEVQVKLATDEVERLLNEAFLNASTLLQPQSIPT